MMANLHHIREDLAEVSAELNLLNSDVELAVPRHEGLLLMIATFKDAARQLSSDAHSLKTGAPLDVIARVEGEKSMLEKGTDVLKALVYKELDKNTDWEAE